MALLSLGMFVFSIPTLAYDQIQRRSEWKHARSPRVGARDAAQYAGPGDDAFSIEGSVHSEISDGRVSLDELHAMADQGEAWQLVSGDGRVFGSFIITSMAERSAAFWPDGSARSIEFGIEIVRVDEPTLSAS